MWNEALAEKSPLEYEVDGNEFGAQQYLVIAISSCVSVLPGESKCCGLGFHSFIFLFLFFAKLKLTPLRYSIIENRWTQKVERSTSFFFSSLSFTENRFQFGHTYGDSTRSLPVCFHEKDTFGEYVKTGAPQVVF